MARAVIVDDSKFMRKIIADILTSAGHTIDGEAENGQEGIRLYEATKPDILTMDITMGGKDGINAIREIKSRFPDSKIVVVSALNQNTIKMNDEGINADAFITKPFTKEELLTIVEKVLQQ
ncbi:MAG TPA: response regulator [Spirochaetota bacterium]|nr:response regulator [Spirochaetota bacterium]HPJ34395.1 response regulator [Spirochaetota bacterium]